MKVLFILKTVSIKDASLHFSEKSTLIKKTN